MMIRINLLPVRQVQKRELGKQFLVLAGIVLFGTLLGNWFWYSTVNGEVEKNQRQIADTQARIDKLQKAIGEVNNINIKKKEIEAKLAVLDDLKKQRAGPVRMLDALSTAIPKKVWITDFTETGNAIQVRGSAASLDDISEFMRGLQSMVWTPKGMGRLVERKRDQAVARVELLKDGSIDEIDLNKLGFFFSGIELKQTQASGSAAKAEGRVVNFELAMGTNYAI